MSRALQPDVGVAL